MSGPNAFKVIAAGLLTTVQDLGRPGWRASGVSESGAVDGGALRLGNWLLLNSENAAALEITALGPVLQALRTCAVCIAGADLGATLNGRPLPRWEVVQVVPGDRIGFSGMVSGCRAYLCVAGGIDVPPVLGSRSTDLMSRLGGVEGRQLVAGDLLPVGRPSRPIVSLVGRRLPAAFVPDYPDAITVRVVLGPQADHFTAEGIETLLTGEYVVGADSNRTAVRLEGPVVAHSALGADIISDGLALGAVQVPSSGQPIVLLAGRQTMGGYAKIATVISSDVWRLSQLRPGDRLRFSAVSVQEAHRIAWDTEAFLARAHRDLFALPAPAPRPVQPVAAAAPAAAPAPVPVAQAPAAAAPAAVASPAGDPARPVHHLKVRLAGREFSVTVAEAE